jgi:hypothetical protein
LKPRDLSGRRPVAVRSGGLWSLRPIAIGINQHQRGTPPRLETRITRRICQFGIPPILNLTMSKDKMKRVKTLRHFSTGKGVPGALSVGIQTRSRIHIRSPGPRDQLKSGYRRQAVSCALKNWKALTRS